LVEVEAVELGGDAVDNFGALGRGEVFYWVCKNIMVNGLCGRLGGSEAKDDDACEDPNRGEDEGGTAPIAHEDRESAFAGKLQGKFLHGGCMGGLDGGAGRRVDCALDEIFEESR